MGRNGQTLSGFPVCLPISFPLFHWKGEEKCQLFFIFSSSISSGSNLRQLRTRNKTRRTFINMSTDVVKWVKIIYVHNEKEWPEKERTKFSIFSALSLLALESLFIVGQTLFTQDSGGRDSDGATIKLVTICNNSNNNNNISLGPESWWILVLLTHSRTGNGNPSPGESKFPLADTLF